MQALRRTGTETRVIVLVLACALGLAIGTVGRAAHLRNHLPRGVAAVALAAADNTHTSARADLHADSAPAAAGAALVRGAPGTGDASTPVRFTTAQSPKVRGPPAEGSG